MMPGRPYAPLEQRLREGRRSRMGQNRTQRLHQFCPGRIEKMRNDRQRYRNYRRDNHERGEVLHEKRHGAVKDLAETERGRRVPSALTCLHCAPTRKQVLISSSSASLTADQFAILIVKIAISFDLSVSGRRGRP